MILRACLIASSLLLGGCIVFDKKSAAVSFHQFAVPSVAARHPEPLVFVPRAVIPATLRRPNLVLTDEAGAFRLDDAHRWLAPLDRAIAESVGRHLTADRGLPVVVQVPAGDHLVLLLTLDKMETLNGAPVVPPFFALPGLRGEDRAVMHLTYRLEKSTGALLATATLTESCPLDERSAPAYVRAQSANLAAIAAAIARELPAPPKSP